ncbi:MAG: hypothetical protein WBQ43_01035 [Terriglobales bacterium]
MKDIPYITDVVEFRIWATGDPCTFNTLEDDLRGAIDPNDYSEDLPQNVMDEIQGRQRMLEGSYPFECDGYSVRTRAGSINTSTYLFCLGLTLLPPRFIESEQRSRQFETIAMNAAAGFFGGAALRIGAPWRDDETPDYRALLKRVVGLIPELGKNIRDAAPDGGDGGWDVLVVKDFKDRMIPRLIALGNCATGLTNWKRKGKETEPDYIWTFFAHTPRSAILTFFAVPFVMDEDARLRRITASNMTFDRFRICEHAPESSRDVADWVESTRAAALEIPFN